MASNSTSPHASEQDVILTLTRDITVRRLRHSDAPRKAVLCNDRNLWLNMRDRFPHPYTLDDAHSWICASKDKSKWLKLGKSWPPPEDAQAIPSNYAIAMKDEPIGAIGLVQGTDVGARTMELGYWVGADYQRQGIMTEVAKAFVEWAFDTFGWLVRLEASVFGWNTNSAKVLDKIPGFELEVVKKAAVFKDGKIANTLEYARIRDGVLQ